MTLAMTIMVRDEADVIGAMIDHHIRQGVDVLLVTDNASSDGTTEILERYAADGAIHLYHHPAHDKRQNETVTAMARRAATEFGADWVLNADADEFWLPVDRSLTLGEVFARMSPALRSFTVPVVDMIGPPAATGAGLDRLVHRDTRSDEDLRSIGLLAHSTHNSAHIADPDVRVSQGNHYVSIPSAGDPPEELRIEVLHLPWRSWEQYERKVVNAGEAYGRSGLTPSPNHHGMRDYRRWLDGTLLPHYVIRHPSADEIQSGEAAGTLLRDDVLASSSTNASASTPLDPAVETLARATGAAMVKADRRILELEEELGAATAEIDRVRDALGNERGRAGSLEVELDAMHARRVVKAVDWVASRVRPSAVR